MFEEQRDKEFAARPCSKPTKPTSR